MTLTDEQLTEAVASSAFEPAAPPAWAEVVDVGRRQRRAKFGTTAAVLVVIGSMAAAALFWSGESAPLETAASDHGIVLGTEGLTDQPVDPAELGGTEWRIAGEWNGDEESLGAVVRFVDIDGPSRRVSIDLSCNSTSYELEWDGWTFTSSAVHQEGALLCFDPDRDIDRYWRSSSTFVARFSGNILIIERDEEELRLVQTAFGRPNRPGAAEQADHPLDPELIFGDWRIIDLGPDGGLIDQTGRADDIRISLTDDEVVVQHACGALTFDAEWMAGSLWTRSRAQDPTLLIGCRSHPGLLNLVEFFDRPGWIATLLVDGQLELARSPGTERIRAMSISAR